MSERIDLTYERHALGSRLLLLAFGTPALGLGIYATVRVLFAMIDIAIGRPFEGHFWIGFLIAVSFTLIGGAFVIAFFLPERRMIFDATTGNLTYRRLFPAGYERVEIFSLSSVPPPEVHWIEDSDRIWGGEWALKVRLPDGRHATMPLTDLEGEADRDRAEALRDRLRRMINAS